MAFAPTLPALPTGGRNPIIVSGILRSEFLVVVHGKEDALWLCKS